MNAAVAHCALIDIFYCIIECRQGTVTNIVDGNFNCKYFLILSLTWSNYKRSPRIEGDLVGPRGKYLVKMHFEGNKTESIVSCVK